MQRDGIRLSDRLRYAFYGVFAVLFATGAAWRILQTTGMQDGEAGNETNAVGPWLMKAHGAAAMAALILLGALYPLHIVRGWQARRNRLSGASLFAVVTLLIVSGYLLYYSGGEELRPAASLIHLWLGLALPGFIVVHIWRGRVLRRRAHRR